MTSAESTSSSHRHQLFEPFVGVFGAEVKIWMGAAEPHVSQGTMTNTFVLDDRYLHQQYVGEEMDGPFNRFEGQGFWGFDPALQRYQGFWIDNASSQMQHETGSVDEAGGVWTMVGEFTNPHNNEVITKRSVITLIDRDQNKMESFVTAEDGSEHKTMEIYYRRK